MIGQAAVFLRANLEASLRSQGGGLFRPSHKNVFTGADVVRALLSNGFVNGEGDALPVGQALLEDRVFVPVKTQRSQFRGSEKDLYRFASDTSAHGGWVPPLPLPSPPRSSPPSPSPSHLSSC